LPTYGSPAPNLPAPNSATPNLPAPNSVAPDPTPARPPFPRPAIPSPAAALASIPSTPVIPIPSITDVAARSAPEIVVRGKGDIHRSGPTTQPSRTELVRRAAALAAVGAPAADQHRRLNPAVVDALIEAGFARHFVPRRWGGVAGTFGELAHAAAEVAEGCASAGWCGALWAAHARFAGYLPEQGQRDLWGRSPDVVIAAAVLPPAGLAVATGDGWLLRGEWDFASGVDFADWVLLAAPTSSARGPGRVRLFAVPQGEVGVRDSWQAAGLRGTGSNTVVVRESFVPDHRSVWFDEIINGLGSDGRPERARCHRVPAHLGGGVLFCAPELGAARHALSTWTRWASQPGPSGVSPLADSAAVREVLARSSAEIESAGLLLAAAADRADFGPVGAEAVARGRRDAAFAAESLVVSVERLVRTGGVHMRNAHGELLRCWRDVHTVASHAALRLDAAASGYAAALPARPEWRANG
jgi:alkylation response protein AidB-like acyl-CoA dehydrogenase